MTHPRPNQRLHRRARALPAALWLLAAAASAQPAARAPIGTSWLANLAAGEQTLWLARVDPQSTQVYRRNVSEPLAPGDVLNAPISQMAAADGILYAFAEDGAFYSLANGQWSPQANLPRRALPVDLLGAGAQLYALINSPPAGEMPRMDAGGRPPTSQPFDPGDAPLSVVCYDSRGWIAVAPWPANVTDHLGAHLAIIHEKLCLLWHSADTAQIRSSRLDPETGRWHETRVAPAPENLAGFWFAEVGRVPTLIVAARTTDGGTDLLAFRLLGGAADGAAEWRPATLQLSELPVNVRPSEYKAAFGFNQHLVLLMAARDRAEYIRFGRTDAPPAEQTVAVSDVFSGSHGPGAGPRWLQSATLLALFAILVLLFVLRRGAMAKTVELPAGCALALTFQRLLGTLIDLTPFVLIGAALTGVGWQAGLRELFGWAVGTDAVSGRLPAGSTLLWWGFSSGAYTVYCLVMELFTQRTVGKVLTGTRVLSESGARASVGQIVLRNLLRLAEAQPPLWILGFLVVLSRNRQRVGDIFARTVVVRSARAKDPDESSE